MRPAPLVDRASPELVHDEPPAESTRPSAFDFAGVVVPVTETRASPAKEVLSSSAVSSLLHHRSPDVIAFLRVVLGQPLEQEPPP
jgi:hypothetical protein